MLLTKIKTIKLSKGKMCVANVKPPANSACLDSYFCAKF